MEATKQRRPKAKSRTPEAPSTSRIAPPPPIPPREAIVNGVRLPRVPQHAPGEHLRPASPEPEEVSDMEETQEAPPAVPPREVRTTEAAPVEISPTVAPHRTAPPIPERLILPKVVAAPLVEPVVEKVPESTIYPAVPQLSAEVLAPPAYSEALPDYAQAIKELVTPAAPEVSSSMYPQIPKLLFEKTRHGLLSEQCLLSFYHNVVYEESDDITDRFISSEEMPSGPLFSLLSRLHATCSRMDVGAANEKENTNLLKSLVQECWIVKEQTVEYKGKCGENNDARGTAQFQSAFLNGDKMNELKKMLGTNRNIFADVNVSLQAQFRSLALQIQWIIISINQQFMAEHGVSPQNPPMLISSTPSNTSRQLLLSALSDLFYHLRFPALLERFVNAVVDWIVELTCILYRMCRPSDCLFVLNHILRLPSPVGEWAAPLIQTFVQTPSAPVLKLDTCIAMLSLILNDIKARDSFLKQIRQFESEDAGWAVLSEDDEAGEYSMVTINETDLISVFSQLPINEVFTVAYLQFSNSQGSNKCSQFTSLVAFQLLLMKILNNGLSTYSKRVFKNFCKHLGSAIRSSVRELCNHWRVMKSSLLPPEEEQLQKEVDRIVLLCLQYMINHESMGLWQFVVDLPYDVASEECRLRCEFLLRSCEEIALDTLYDMPISEVRASLKRASLKERTEKLGALDAVFVVNALASIASYSRNDPSAFIKEVIEVCFCEESSRESLYKVGSEAIAQLVSKRTNVLDALLTIIDRNLDHMDQYGINVLSSSTLTHCRISLPVLATVGKWLTNKPPDAPANRLARRVLSSLHWGPVEGGSELWMDENVHEACAEIIVKAHLVQCTNANGMLLAKSIEKVTKLARKMPDFEQHFNQFCWDMLVKLKLPAKARSGAPQSDLAAYFVQLTCCCLSSIDTFLDEGVSLLNQLVTAGCSTAAIVVVAQVMQKYYQHVDRLVAHPTFCDVVDRIAHFDQCPYAVQFIMGPSSMRTPIVRLFSSAITYSVNRVNDPARFLQAWITVFCTKRQWVWNADSATLQLLDVITRIAFLRDASSMLGIKAVVLELYQQALVKWKESSGGLFSIFSSKTLPALIEPTYCAISPWATYLLLSVEADAFVTFYQFVYETLAKKPTNTVEKAVERASSKTSQSLPLQRLSVYRWAEFVNVAKDSSVFAPALQALAIACYSPRSVNGQRHIFARRLIDCPNVTVKAIMEACKKTLDSNNHEKGFANAVSGWLFTSHDVTRHGFDFSTLNLDYLLQLVIAGDENPWTDYIDLAAIQKDESTEEQMFILSCHLHEKERSRLDQSTEMHRWPATRAKPFASLPQHGGLPPAPVFEFNALFQQHVVVQLVGPFIAQLNKIAEEVLNGVDNMNVADEKYCEQLTRLYFTRPRTVRIQLKCGMRCGGARDQEVTVNAHEYSTSVDAEMTANRNARNATCTQLHANVVDQSALCLASLEHLIRTICSLSAQAAPLHSESIQMSGAFVLRHVTSSIDDSTVLFSAAVVALEHILRALGEQFVRFRPQQQFPIAHLVLNGFVLSHPLVEVFTPECLTPVELCDMYALLSDTVLDAEKCPRAIQLLARLGMDKASAHLPPQQFTRLLPLAFRNLTSQPNPTEPLHQLSLGHFVTFAFHAFPSNFVSAMDVIMDGCNNGLTPTGLLEDIVNKIGADSFDDPHGVFVVDVTTAAQCVTIMSRRLNEGRRRITSIFSVYGRYAKSVSQLAQLFLFTPLRLSFNTTISVRILEEDLTGFFTRTVSVYAPLIAPLSTSIPPFMAANEGEAAIVMESLVQLLNALPYNAALPAGTQGVLSHCWKWYFEQLSTLSHGTTHYYAFLEKYLMRLPWSNFWPTQLGLNAMNECLASRSGDTTALVVQIVVRVPWTQLLTQFIDAESRAQYLSTLFQVLTRILAKSQSYSKVSASLCDLLKQLCQRSDWSSLSLSSVLEISSVVASISPGDVFINSSPVCSTYAVVWRKLCQFSTREAISHETVSKRAACVRTEMALLLKCNVAQALPAYNSLLSDVNAILTPLDDVRMAFPCSFELTAAWSSIKDAKLGESLVTSLNEYLSTNSESPLIYSCLNTVISSMHSDQLTTALKVMERTIASYFQEPAATWSKVLEYASFPKAQIFNIEQYILYLPSKERKHDLLFLTLRAYIDYSAGEERILLRVHELITNIRPKHVTNDAEFVSLLYRYSVFLAEYCSAQKSFTAENDLFGQLIRFLNKAARDDSSFLSNLISSKKTVHSQKLRVVLSILELYLTQQSNGDMRQPRCAANAPVLNCRKQAFRDLAAQKAMQPFGNVFNAATCYFVQVEEYHLGSTPSLLRNISRLLYKEHYLSDK